MKNSLVAKFYFGLLILIYSFFTLSRYDLIPRFAWSIEKSLYQILAILAAVLLIAVSSAFAKAKAWAMLLLAILTYLPIGFFLYISFVD